MTSPQTNNIAQKLWGLCEILRIDVPASEFATELTLLLFLKLAKENGTESQLPEGYRWNDLLAKKTQPDFYRELLSKLGQHFSPLVRGIYANATSSIRQPKQLEALVQGIDSITLVSSDVSLGDVYEELLEKWSGTLRGGEGRFSTPRPLIESIIRVLKPKAGELVQDPAAGTGGFLVYADRYIKEQTDDLFSLPEKLQVFQMEKAFYGLELDPNARRLGLMNLLLHNLRAENLELGDALSSVGVQLAKADVIVTNPPFGIRASGQRPYRDDLLFPTSNPQLAFLQHVYQGLKPRGRAAVIVPDNVLFAEGVARQVRSDLMEKCNLHTILRLPQGVFYAKGVKASVLFFSRGLTDKNNTKQIWFYNLRSEKPPKGMLLNKEIYVDFEIHFGDEPFGNSHRTETNVFTVVSRDGVRELDDNLDIIWEVEDTEDLFAALKSHLQSAYIGFALNEFLFYVILIEAIKEIDLYREIDSKISYPSSRSISDLINKLKSKGMITDYWSDRIDIDKIEPYTLNSAIELIDRMPKDRLKELPTFIIENLNTTVGTNGQFVTPSSVGRLMVEFVAPTLGESICDPACGTASLLVDALNYLSEEDPSLQANNVSLWGFDFDARMLKAASLNLMLRGIGCPNIHYQDTLSDSFQAKFPNQAKNSFDVILSNPPFGGFALEGSVNAELVKRFKTRKLEHLFLLLAIHLLKQDGRAAIIVPRGFLFRISKSDLALRQLLIEENRLDCVISLPSGAFKPYTNIETAILFFHKDGITENTFFYDITLSDFSTDPGLSGVIEKLGYLWKNKNTYTDRESNFFTISAKEIKGNDYSLAMSQYKNKRFQVVESPRDILDKIQAIEHEIQETLDALREAL